MISSEHLQVFSRALNGCLGLQKVFPSDPQLRAVVADLQGWIRIHCNQEESATAVEPRYPRRPDARYIRPLSEEVAFLVDDAVRQIGKLNPC